MGVIPYNSIRDSIVKKEITPPDKKHRIRCPRLGHQIPFFYCRSENRGLPCFKTLDCWYEHFTVEEYLQGELSPEQWEKTFNRPSRPKMLLLMDLIEEAKKRNKEKA